MEHQTIIYVCETNSYQSMFTEILIIVDMDIFVLNRTEQAKHNISQTVNNIGREGFNELGIIYL